MAGLDPTAVRFRKKELLRNLPEGSPTSAAPLAGLVPAIHAAFGWQKKLKKKAWMPGTRPGKVHLRLSHIEAAQPVLLNRTAVGLTRPSEDRRWIAGSSPAMTRKEKNVHARLVQL